jgi:hypothetical protein
MSTEGDAPTLAADPIRPSNRGTLPADPVQL